MMMTATGRSRGTVTRQKICHSERPSMRAASYTYSGSDWSAAKVTSMTNGVHCQTSATTTEMRPRPVSVSHGSGSSPSNPTKKLAMP